jgi:RNA polymerase-binding protein DksA
MHLNPEERSRLRTRLVKLRHDAQERITRQRSALAEPGKNRAVGDGTEDTQNEMLTGTTIDLTVQATRILTQVDDALRAVSRDEYGACLRCDGPISVTRLEALPFASLCIGCAQDDETEVRRRRHVPVYPQL